MNPCLATDMIIEYSDGQKDGIVLITRKNPPFGLALPGGMLDYGLTLEENAVKEAKEETNLEYKIDRLLCVVDDPQRDPRHHIVSAVFVGKGYGKLQAGDDAKEAYLLTLPELERFKDELVFDHAKIIERYLRGK